MVKEGYEDITPLKAWKEIKEPIHPVKYEGMFDVEMRDGIKLSTDVFLPADIEGDIPAILVRTPYGKELNNQSYFKYVQRGYAVVIQDVRGRNLSEGEWMPNYTEVEDGDDTITWIANRPWCNKKVGMIGGSYLGYVQWAAAASGNPYLSAMVSIVCAGSAFMDLPRRGGCLTSGMLAWAFSVSQKKFKPELMERDDWEEVLNIRPLENIPEIALGYKVDFLDNWFKNPDYCKFWADSDWHARSKRTVIPTLIMSGWFDDNGMGTTQALDIVKDFPVGKRKVILGPWQHSGNSRYDLHGVDFGANALRFDIDLNFLKWFDLHLKGIENGIDKTSPVEYYTVGDNEWKTAENWPVPETEKVELFLDSKGNANTSYGDGKIVFENPTEENVDEYEYDPNNPSIHIIDMSENEIEVPEDYTEEEKRDDMLCYTTDVLEEDFTITGDMDVELYVSSDAVDTDFIVRITDVDENGKSIKLADGILGAKYRNSFEHPEFMEEGKVYKLNILTTKISNTFKKGHRIRVTITSSAKNFMFPNSNTKDGFNSETYVVANNKVHHGGRYSSKVTIRKEN
ncbi:CocE/NonD family hydrolase [Peptacetobacter hiranonis]|uniref:CocE/NonD family hydrolase n=1 Tax=Peptacetobacter hiranonis TaxID=89152 RepID=UPI0012575BF2|nr:CocE/NonD family hydrolase [Peptacetobacter hiranonis]QEK19764.1 Cocaine esterase [Peptacetobacter hiranonis]